MTDKKVICWDLDETLGNFRRIGYEMSGEKPLDFEPPNAIRYGITDVLNSLTEDGYTHFVTTSGTQDYAIEALTRAKLVHHFKEIFGRDVVTSLEFPDGKLYRPVTEIMGFSDEEAMSNMIVVGDAPGDIPANLDGLVFIEHIGCFHTDAIVTKKILDKLNSLGEYDFKKGFDKMLEDSVLEKIKWGSFESEIRTYEIEDEIKMKVEYEYNPNEYVPEEKTIPVISGIKAEKYRKEPVLFE